MAYASPIQTAVNSGELSPRMAARVDFDRYRNAAARARNIILLPTGGFTKAPGSRFINAIKDETKVGRLLPFKFSQTDTYIIEMAENAARFYRRQARIDAPNVGATISNGTFTTNTTDWDDLSTNTSPVVRTFLGSATVTTDTAAYSNVGSALTLPASGNLLVVGIGSRKGTAPANAPSSVTVTILDSAGNALVTAGAMTSVATQTPASPGQEHASLWRYRLPDLPGAASWSFAVTYAAAQQVLTLGAWAVDGAVDVPTDTDSASATATNRAATIDIPANGVSFYVGVVGGATGSGQDQTWTGATEDFDANSDSVARITASSETTVAAAPGNGASYSSAVSALRSIVAASWAPGGVVHDSINGRMRLQPTGNGVAIAQQDVTTSTTGVEHVVAFKVEGDLGAKVLVAVGSSSGGDQLFEETELGMGWHTIAFTPAASPYYLQFKNRQDDPPEPIYIDDVVLLDNVPLQLTTDYSESELADLSIRQSADVLYLFHPDIPTRKLERRGHRTWSLVTVPWDDGPYGASNPGVDVQIKNLIRNPGFFDGLRYWDNKSITGAEIEWDAAQHIATFIAGGNSGEDAKLEQQVATGITVSDTFVLHFRVLGGSLGPTQPKMSLKIGTTSDGSDIHALTVYEQGWHSVRFTSAAATWFIRFITPRVSGVVSPTTALGGCYLYRSNARLMQLSAVQGSVTCTAIGHTPFKSSDVGRIMRFTWPGKEPAWGIVTNFISTFAVQIRLRREAAYASVPTEDWRLGKWSARTGYPRSGAFFQSRLIAANTEFDPQTLEFTQSGDLENLRPDTFSSGASVTEDDDGLSYQIASEEVNAIAWMTGRRKLIVGTSGGQFVAESQGAAISATDISITPHSDVPCMETSPIAIESAVVFLEDGGRAIHDLGFQINDEAFVSSDLTILAGHMLRSPAVEAVLQRRPLQIIWVRRADGRLACLAYNRRQDIVGWSHRLMGGSFSGGNAVVESIAPIPGFDDAAQALPSGERDEVWEIVKRTINGATHRYIEVFEGYYEAPVREDYDTEGSWETAVKADMVDAFYVDCGITYNGSPTTSITGLSHLEGQTVAVLADGRVHSREVVSGGAITLDYAASKVQVGLPYAWQFETLKLPHGTQSGSGVTKQKSIPAVGLCLLDAGPFSLATVAYDELEGRVVYPVQELEFLRDGLAMDEAIPLFTGEIVRNLDGAVRRDNRVYLEGSAPLPFTLLAIVPQMNAGER